MKKRVTVNVPDEYHLFTDIDDCETLYCISPDDYDEIFPFLDSHSGNTRDAPDYLTVKASKCDFLSVEKGVYNYSLSYNDKLDFQVNRIEWIIRVKYGA